ncbi:hypothetical protein [Luteimonas aquatica]|uniref:hypothetical protein n=1 Tax=Luteimonas aquatica TaxID=450364 RepID=UPI001F5963A1|nr:hypothetical protein [Luteimonas aquatica]
MNAVPIKAAIACLAGALWLLPAATHAQKKPAASGAAKKLYCWDENGHRVCGDTLPPEATDRARTELNASGKTVKTLQRTQTEEERAAAAIAEKQARLAAEDEAAAKRRDLAMAESYASEADLRRAYGDRIVLLDESLKGSRLAVLNLRQSLLGLLRQAADLELQSKPVGKPLTEKILRQHADLLRLQETLHHQTADRALLGSDLEQTLERYRALKGAKGLIRE